MKRAGILLCLPLLLAFEPLQSRNKDIEVGNAQMKAGKAEDALASYDKAIAKLPTDPAAHFDRGTALYALSRFEEAGQEFLRATEAKDGALKASAFYNLGNAFFKKDKFKEAVEAYRRTLALDPRDARAKWNLEIALKKQKEEDKKKEDQKNKDDQNKDKDKKDDQKKDDQKKDDKKDQQKNDQDKKKDDQKKDDQKKDDKKDQQKNDQAKDQPKDNPAEKPPEQKPGEQQDIGAVLDSLERSPKDLEKERARLRAVRRRPPERDW